MPLSNYLAPSAIAKPGVCTSSTRPASPYEGQFIYETDTDKTFVWNGSTWVQQFTASVVDAKGDLLVASADDTLARLAVGSNNQVLVADSSATNGVKWAALSGIGGAWTDYSPTLSQNGSVTRTVDFGKYIQIGKVVFGSIYVTATGTGSAGSHIAVSLPVTALSGSTAIIGSGFIYDASATVVYTVTAQLGSTTAMWFYSDQTGTASRWGIAPSVALGNTDQIGIWFTYEAA
jgi:hypothetical protein